VLIAIPRSIIIKESGVPLAVTAWPAFIKIIFPALIETNAPLRSARQEEGRVCLLRLVNMRDGDGCKPRRDAGGQLVTLSDGIDYRANRRVMPRLFAPHV
jgi:hypothetical protein